ncbi:MAG TPA: tetratricopeptide repeat protein [Aggregatilineales bacterium]|nr:tetratricopeptide repeat protein [Anaerolineales bacterium]HRE49441.1 tetratricopeptide repeat protein [Aggregatilineales bacterium]
MSERVRERRRLERENRRQQYALYDDLAGEAPSALELAEDARYAQRMSLLKFTLVMSGVAMLLFTGLITLALIILPTWFRSLPTSEQVVWMNRLPLLEAFKPTRVYGLDTLPTANPGNDATAMALLGNPPALGTEETSPPSAEAVVPAVPSPSLTPSLPFVSRVTPMLATNTPVIAAIGATPTPGEANFLPPPTATFAPTLPPLPPPTFIPVPAYYQASGYKFVKQKWNTCGPANLTQALNYLGWTGGQDTVIDYLKPDREDRNVNPWELVNFVNEYLNAQRGTPYKALVRVGGTLDLLKRIVANNFAVIIEKGYSLPEEGWLGHYLTIQGYDDTRGEMHGLDTYLGDRWESYDSLDTRWQQFNRVFIVIYPADRERELADVLGGYKDVNYAIQFALSKAKEEASIQTDNPYAWFNLGSAYVLQGDYARAATAFDRARNIGTMLPWRFLWYQFTPYEAYYHAGNYGEVLKLANATLANSADLEESLYWKGMALAAQGDYTAAKQAFQRAVRINTRSTLAAQRLAEIDNGTFRPPL